MKTQWIDGLVDSWIAGLMHGWAAAAAASGGNPVIY
jgi:hypothetical protein